MLFQKTGETTVTDTGDANMQHIRNEWFLETLKKKIAQKKKIAFPDTLDPRTIEAVEYILHNSSVIEPILIGSEQDIAAFLQEQKKNDLLQKITVFDPKTYALMPELVAMLDHSWKEKEIPQEEIQKMLSSSALLFAGALLAYGEIDGVVAGSLSTTANVIRAAIRTVGVESYPVSSYFLMLFEQTKTVWAYADCGVIPYPSAEELAQIALQTAENFEKLTNIPPCVAFLSFSTKGSADHESVQKVRKAVALAQKKAPQRAIDGEFQFDAATVPEIGKRKAPDSPVAGNANVFIFPNLDAGNIAYKITERLGKAQAIGPNLQGLRKPYLDLSRGCASDDIVISSHLAAVLSAL